MRIDALSRSQLTLISDENLSRAYTRATARECTESCEPKFDIVDTSLRENRNDKVCARPGYQCLASTQTLEGNKGLTNCSDRTSILADPASVKVGDTSRHKYGASLHDICPTFFFTTFFLHHLSPNPVML